jgi:hypothetical protein
MSLVGTNFSTRLGGWMIQCWQLICRFIFSRKVTNVAIPILVGLFPIALTQRIMRVNWTSVPYGDDWWTPGRQIVSFVNGTLRLADLFQQHNESRPLFPNLYYILMTAITGRWDVKDAMVLIFVMVCAGSLLLFELLRRTTSFDLSARLWAWALLNVVLFCPREYENFLWGIMVLPFTPGVALLAAVLMSLSKVRLRWKILTNSVLAFLATYSFANGMLLWVLAMPIYAGGQSTGTRNRKIDSIGWYGFYGVFAIISVAFYFRHYVHPAQLPPFSNSPSDAIPLLHFLLVWIGSLFVVAGADPFFFGGFFSVLFAGLAVAAIAVARREGNFWRFYPWMIIGAYALLSGTIVALGRMRFGIGSALPLRYAAVSVFFYLALAGLAATLYDAWVASGHSLNRRIVFATGLILGLFAAGWLSSFTTQLSHVKLTREERRDLALAVQWIPAIPLNPDLGLAKVPPKIVAEKAIALSKCDALRPRLVTESLASMVEQNPPAGNPSVGILETAHFSTDHRLLLTGMAWLPDRQGRADCVVVGYINSAGTLTPFTVFQPTYMRERLKGQFDFKRLPTNGFAAVVDPGNLPLGELTLRAWAVDFRTERALPMVGAIAVDNEPAERN